MAADYKKMVADLLAFYDLGDKTVLSVGAGGGQLIEYGRTARKVLALDSDALALEKLRENLEAAGLEDRFEPVLGDFFAIDLKADVVLFEFCLHEMADPGAAVERARGLAPAVVVFDHGPGSEWSYLAAEERQGGGRLGRAPSLPGDQKTRKHETVQVFQRLRAALSEVERPGRDEPGAHRGLQGTDGHPDPDALRLGPDRRKRNLRRSPVSVRHTRSRAAGPVLLAALVLLSLLAPARADSPAAPAKTRGTPGVPPGIDATVARIMKTFEVPGLAPGHRQGRHASSWPRATASGSWATPAPVDAQDPLRHRLQLQGLHGDRPRPARRGRQDRLGRARRRLPALVHDVRSLRHPRAQRPRPPRPPQRARPRRRATCSGGRSRRTTAKMSRAGSGTSSRRRRFRSAYAYDNVLYLVAGEVIQAVTGLSWEDFVAERILKKVGMTGSNVRHSAAAEGGNVATPHARVEGAVRPIAPFTSDNTNPAGGINSGAEDMARWMQVRLARGKLADGTALYSERTARELETPVTVRPNSAPPAELAGLKTNFDAYALGLGVRDYRGERVIDPHGRPARLRLASSRFSRSATSASPC
ncbi:MAG: serine hydrolase [Sphingobacterium sp.]|nr:serine hydrolase [Sphingobacterium sp.]